MIRRVELDRALAMLGKIIRSPVEDIRIAGRSTQGVTLFDTADDEQVVSVAHLKETDETDNGEADDHVAEDTAESAEEQVSGDPDGEVDDAAGDA